MSTRITKTPLARLLALLALISLFTLGGCQSTSPTKDTSEYDIYSPSGPVIHAIQKDIAANRLTRPTGNNALEKIQRLKLINPNSPAIDEYETKIARKLVSLGQKAFLDNNYDQAKILAVRALEIKPDLADAGYILDAVREAEMPLESHPEGVHTLETVQIEKVEETSSVNVITVTIPDLQQEHLETTP